VEDHNAEVLNSAVVIKETLVQMDNDQPTGSSCKGKNAHAGFARQRMFILIIKMRNASNASFQSRAK
jgi:hypothetical protein